MYTKLTPDLYFRSYKMIDAAEFTDFYTKFSLEEKIRVLKKELSLLNKFKLNNQYQFKPKYIALKNKTYIDLLTNIDARYISSGAYGQTFQLGEAGKICFKVATQEKMNLVHEVLAGYIISEKYENFAQTLGYKLDLDSEINYNLNSYSIILFLEYIQGETLFKIGSKFTEDEVKSILFQIIFTILDAGEDFKFNHNDLHLNNVMVEFNERPVTLKYKDGYQIKTYYVVKIIDFGISRFVYDNTLFHASNRSNFSWKYDLITFFKNVSYFKNFSDIIKTLPDIRKAGQNEDFRKYTDEISPKDLKELKKEIGKILLPSSTSFPPTSSFLKPKDPLKLTPTNILELNILGTKDEKIKRQIYENEMENITKNIDTMLTIDIPSFDPLIFDDIKLLERVSTLNAFKDYSNKVLIFFELYIETVEKIEALKKYRDYKVENSVKQEIKNKLAKISEDALVALNIYLPEVFGGVNSDLIEIKSKRRKLQLISKNYNSYKNYLILFYNMIERIKTTSKF